MRSHTLISLVLLICSLLGSASHAGEGVLQVRSATKVTIDGHPHLVVIAAAPHNVRVRLVVPNLDPQGSYDPAPDQLQIIRGLKPNALVEATWDTANGVNRLTSIAFYTPKPGETSPNGYIFRGTQLIEKTQDLAVLLDKLGGSTTATIPAFKDKDGKPTHDAALMAALASLNEGDPVWVELSGASSPRLLAILPWTEPQAGKVAKVTTADVDGHAQASIQIETAAGKVDALVPGEMVNGTWTPNSRIAGLVKLARLNDPVQFRTQQEDTHLWLRDLQFNRPTPIARNSPGDQRPGASPASGDGDGDGVPGVIDHSSLHRSVPGASEVPGVGSIPGGF